MGETTVELCGAGDARLLARIGEETFRETYVADTPADELERHVAGAYDPAILDRELARDGSRFFIARVEGEPAGYLKINTGDAQTELQEAEGLEIESLYVLRRFQGFGVGRLLLDRALAEAKEQGAEYVWLGVWKRNARARRFWARQGFVEFGSHPFQFGDVEHTDVLMRRPMPGSG